MYLFSSFVVLPGVANRDIKLDNILLDRSLHGKADWPILKICDWGYAKHDAKSIAKSRVVSGAADLDRMQIRDRVQIADVAPAATRVLSTGIARVGEIESL
jgi:serine/threonine protein kinase